MEKIWISESSWYIYCKQFVECNENDFEKLWYLNELFEVHSVKMYGKWIKIPRKQGLFSEKNISYNFSGSTVKSLKIPNNDVLKECMSSLEPIDDYNALFFNWYKDGTEYISAHRDNEKGLMSGISIASISLGATRTFRIRNYMTKHIVKDVYLEHGSLFVMGGAFQKEFTHEVPKTSKPTQRRINITCRNFE